MTRPPSDRRARWRVTLGNVVFNNDTPAGRAFDLVLIVLILASIGVVMLDSVRPLRTAYGPALKQAELVLTLLFSLEYGLRLITARHPWNYARSFFGVVDLLSILPGYLALFVPGAETLLIVRVLRLLRIFRILKLARFLSEASVLTEAIRASAAKITVFLVTVLTLVTIIGALMYLIEGPDNGYTSIPTSIYWAIVTLTTVGYGDIAPKTPLGKGLASLAMILGYGILAVPTGIVTVSLARAQGAAQDQREQGGQDRRPAPRVCPRCGLEGHDADARFCKRCGEELPSA
ncbi:voltage-gated potassium channel [Deinococcus sp. HSC-46F16]|uniref:ion transporter n=1 Tax=Deinococcus sp. HSC-46F16 TaxID=2910968 RepID=UPI00209D6EF3|nr:ion transporter [Deinococcus sp. HSC-46F16]MCP2013281.1 voltage-gated potassium channel [Deinococcus sp. HSC-46F16]